jgi:hypothetical protein
MPNPSPQRLATLLHTNRTQQAVTYLHTCQASPHQAKHTWPQCMMLNPTLPGHCMPGNSWTSWLLARLQPSLFLDDMTTHKRGITDRDCASLHFSLFLGPFLCLFLPPFWFKAAQLALAGCRATCHPPSGTWRSYGINGLRFRALETTLCLIQLHHSLIERCRGYLDLSFIGVE